MQWGDYGDSAIQLQCSLELTMTMDLIESAIRKTATHQLNALSAQFRLGLHKTGAASHYRGGELAALYSTFRDNRTLSYV
jgi:hypothetical protein